MDDGEALVPKKPSIPARTVKCVTGTPKWCVECWLSCVVEMRDTIVYCTRCCLHGPPSMVRGCVESIRKFGEDPKGEIKSCCAPSPGCCGHSHPNGHFHICYNKPVDWAKLCCFFAILWTYVALFFIGLMLVYMAIGGYTPAAI